MPLRLDTKKLELKDLWARGLVPDDEELKAEGDRLLKEAQLEDEGVPYREADAKEEARYNELRIKRLQGKVAPAEKPAVTMKTVEKAFEKRKEPFMYRPDYKPKEKLAEEEALVREMIAEGFPGITQKTRRDSFGNMSKPLSSEDQIKNAMKVLKGQQLYQGVEKVYPPQWEMDRDYQRTWKLSDEAMERRGKTIDRYAKVGRKPTRMSHRPLEDVRDETFLEYLSRRRQMWKDAVIENREQELPPRGKQPGDEGYYFGTKPGDEGYYFGTEKR